MSVVAVWTTNDKAPFVGYGPAGVLAKGDSGIYHLLAHLDPTAWSDDNRPTIGQRYDVGEQVGFPSRDVAPSHVHWEVRIKPIDSPDTRGGNTLDPLQWANGFSVTKAGAPSGGIPWWLVVLVLYAARKR
jgi:murein DD-endopeptidase MepM/ murein hydrolase activator NlpD